MRIYIPSMEHAKRVSKRLQKALKSNPPLHACQLAIARSLGFKDWHELEQVTNSGREASAPDSQVPFEIAEARRRFQAARIASTDGLGFQNEVYGLMEVDPLIESIKPSDYSRNLREQSLEDTVFPKLWHSQLLTDEEPENSDALSILLSFEYAETTGIRSRAIIGGIEPVLHELHRRYSHDSFPRLPPTDEMMMLALFDEGQERARWSVAFGLELFTRSGFIEQIQIRLDTIFGDASPGHLQHAAVHLATYLMCDRLHPAFDAEMTSNPMGLDVVIRVSDHDQDGVAKRLAGLFEDRRASLLDGGFLVDRFCSPNGKNEFPVRSVRIDRNELDFADAQRQDPETDENPEGKQAATAEESFVDGLVREAIRDATYGNSIPHVVSVYVRARGWIDLADQLIQELRVPEKEEKAIAFIDWVKRARALDALDPCEAAFAIDWALTHLLPQTQTIEEYEGPESDDAFDRRYEQQLRSFGLDEMADAYVEGGPFFEYVELGAESILGSATLFVSS